MPAKLKKAASLFVAMCFSTTIFSMPVLANADRGNNKTQTQKKEATGNNKRVNKNDQNKGKQGTSKPSGRNEQKQPNQNTSGRNEQKNPNQNTSGRNEQKNPNQNTPRRNEQKNSPRDNNKGVRKDMPRDHRRDNVVITVVRSNSRDFERARNERLTLRDFIIALYIAKQLGYNDYMPVYVMKKNGRSYRSICRDHGIRWNDVNSHLDNRHKSMNEDAVKLGIALWALDDVIN